MTESASHVPLEGLGRHTIHYISNFTITETYLLVKMAERE
ncbi:MAG: hypothetical protein ACI87O_002764, partial [Planctomycetota bacterium]